MESHIQRYGQRVTLTQQAVPSRMIKAVKKNQPKAPISPRTHDHGFYTKVEHDIEVNERKHNCGECSSLLCDTCIEDEEVVEVVVDEGAEDATEEVVELNEGVVEDLGEKEVVVDECAEDGTEEVYELNERVVEDLCEQETVEEVDVEENDELQVQPDLQASEPIAVNLTSSCFESVKQVPSISNSQAGS